MEKISLCLLVLLCVIYCLPMFSIGCDVEVRVSSMGMGLFAGQNWTSGELEVAIGVPVPLPVIFGTELVNYVEGLNRTHCLLALGVTLLVNHAPQWRADGRDNLRKFMSLFYSPMFKFNYPYGWSIDIVYDLRTTVLKGEEFLTNYGGDDWLEDRGVSVVDFENEEWRPVPGCPLELTRWSNQRLLASSFIARGTVIEVSRAILVPITDVLLASGPLKDLIWWPPSAAETCSHQAQEDLSRFKGTYLVQPYQEEYRYALLLTGRGLLYSAGTKAASNVGYAWFGERMACGLLDMVSFVALRDIQEGEELIVALDIAEDGRRIILDDFASPCL